MTVDVELLMVIPIKAAFDMSEKNLVDDEILEILKDISLSNFGIGNPSIVSRKIIWNHGSYVVSVPFDWLEENKVKDGKLIITRSENALIILPNHSNIIKVLEDENIDFEKKNTYTVADSSCYVSLPKEMVNSLNLEGKRKIKRDGIQKVMKNS